MDTTTLTLENESRQERKEVLTANDRRLLLGASLRLLGRRFSHDQPIFHDDVIRMASLADDASERAA